MKLNNDVTSSVESNRQFESKEFGIGDASMIINILRSKMYSHPIRTLVQEYICNGRDATREAGNSRPLTISVPNALSPVFKVRDYGVGLSPDRIRNVFTMYGSSTKRSTNTQTGGFGIGAKSAWAYTDSFTIVSYLDGIARHYVAHIGRNNNGTLEHIKEHATKEPNGTEIQVAAKREDLTKFKEAIERAVYFWPEMPEIKGLLPEEFAHSSKTKPFTLDNLQIFKENSVPGHIIRDSLRLLVVDGVVYNFPSNPDEDYDSTYNATDEKLRHWLSDYRVAAVHIGNGVVELAASREMVSDTEATRKALKLETARLARAIKTYVKDTFKAEAKDINTYLQTFVKLNAIFDLPNEYAEHKGYKFKFGYDNADGAIVSEHLKHVDMVDITFKPDGNPKRSPKTHLSRWGNKIVGDSVTLKEYRDGLLFWVDNKTETNAEQNKRLRKFGKPVVLFTPQKSKLKEFKKIKDDLGLQKLSSLPMPSKAEVEAWRGARPAKVAKPSKVVSAAVYERNANRRSYAEVDWYAMRRYDVDLTVNTSDYIYTSTETKLEKADLVALTVYFKSKNLAFCLLSETSIDKVKNNKYFTSLDEYAASFKYSVSEVRTITKRVFSESNFSFLEELKNHRADIKNAELNDAIEQLAYKDLKNAEVPKCLVAKVGEPKELQEAKELRKTIDKLLKTKYPLLMDLSSISHTNFKELVWYINAKE